MKSAITLTFLLLLSAACNGNDSPTKVVIDNALSDCIDIKQKQVESYETVWLLDTSWLINNNIGVCGCKSAALYYEVSTEDSDIVLTHGVVSTLNRNKYKFVISTDNTIFNKHKLLLKVSCNN